MPISERDTKVQRLRPMLDLPPAGKPMERFQNEVLRPILKFQNDWILGYTKLFLHKRNKEFNQLNRRAQEQLIRQSAMNDPELRNTLISGVVGMLTTEELEYYFAQRAECNKRLIQMAIQRILDQVEQLY